MVSMAEKSTLQRQVQYNGIIHALVADGEVGIFTAFLEFAIHHSHSDILIYENAVKRSLESAHKHFFNQLICRKRDVINKLKEQQSGSSRLHVSDNLRNGHSLKRFVKDTASDLLIDIGSTLRFALEKERMTLKQYEKLGKMMLLYSTKALFDYLMESQQNLISFLETQKSIESNISVSQGI